MAARTSTGLGVGIAVTLLGIATLGLFVFSIIMWSKANAQEKRANEYESRTSEFVSDGERNQDAVVRIKDQAKQGKKSLVGYLMATQGELMQRVTGAATDTAKDIDGKFGEAAKGTNILSLYRSSQTEITSLKSQLDQAKADAERARQDQVAESARVKEIERSKNEALAAINKELDDYKTQVDVLRESINGYKMKSDERVQRITDEFGTEKTAMQSQLDTLQRDTVVANSRIARMEGELKGKRFVGESEYALVDATVIGMNSGDGTATINVGRKDKLRIGMTFEAYSDAADIRPDDKTGEYPAGKASLEVVNMDDHSATVRILREKRGNPLVRGDVVANAVYDPKKVYKFVIYGAFDANRDGRATLLEADDWQAKITGWGGKVLPDLSGEVDYLVLGERPVLPPEPAATAPVEAVEEWLRVKQAAQRFDDLFKKATETSIPILNENRLRTLIGDVY